MKIISMVSQKGGVGKSTLSVNIATYFDKFLNKKSILIDIDPQASSSSWYDLRDDETPIVISCQPQRLNAVIHTASQSQVDLIIIDTPGKIEGSSLKASKLSDYCVIPVKSAFFDLKAAEETLDICKLAKKDPYVVLNELPPTHSSKTETLDALNNMEAKVFHSSIGDRVVFKHSIANGLSVNEYDSQSKAAHEVSRLCHEMLKVFEI